MVVVELMYDRALMWEAWPGYISGFPNTYATKVGKTSDAMYKGAYCLVLLHAWFNHS